MFEFARHADGVLPRVWGVNHHPEIGDLALQRDRLNRLEARGEVTAAWVAERQAALEAWSAASRDERRLQLTNAFTFERPLHDYVVRALSEKRL
jgi:hypothetical protein